MLSFSFLYYPHVDRVRDFFPHWVENQWTEASLERDLKIMRSLGARNVRYHILPANYRKDTYPGMDADHYRRLIPFSLRTAHDLGMETHVDLHTDDFEGLQAEDLLERIREFGPENIDVLQVINEYFFLWNHEENRTKIENLFDRIRESGFTGHLCLDAGGSVHRKIRESHPKLADYMSDMLPMHHYPANPEWDDFSIDLFLDLLTNGNRVDVESLTPEERGLYDKMMCEQFGGLARELRVMEINMVGFPFWSHWVSEGRGSRWPELMRRLEEETNVSTVCHTTFKDKMSWREYGCTQAGVLYACELPHPEMEAFKRTAMDMMPSEDVYAAFEVDIGMPEEDGVLVAVRNKTAGTVAGKIVPGNGEPRDVDLAPDSITGVRLPVAELVEGDGGVRHLFAECVPESAARPRRGRCIGWAPYTTIAEPALAQTLCFATSGVEYPDGVEPVEAFLRRNRDRLAIMVEPPGCLYSELACRLQSIVAEAWGVLPDIAAMLGTGGVTQVLRDKALIILGARGENSLLRCIETLLEPKYLPGASPGATVSAHPGLFQRTPRIADWPVSSVMHSIGDASFSPGALLVIGSSFECVREGVHDLAQRISPPGEGAAAYTAENHREAYSGLPLNQSRRFAVELAPGAYHVRVAAGTKLVDTPTHTRVIVDGGHLDGSVRTENAMQWLETDVTHAGGPLVVGFEPGAGGRACPAAMVVVHRGTGARVFKGYFCAAPRVDMDFEGYAQVTDDTKFGRAVQKTDWQDIRSGDNEFVSHALSYGWM